LKRRLLALSFWLALCLGFGLSVQKISFETDFEVDKTLLLEASGLKTGFEYEPADVNAAIEALRGWLQNSGHPFVKIYNPELIPISGDEMELLFRLEERVSPQHCQIKFRGLRYFSEAKLREILLLGKNEELPLAKIPELMERILDEYQRRGYLFASVQLDSLTLEDGFTAQLAINEGKQLKPEQYYFQGNKHTRDKTLVKLAGFSADKVLTPQAIQNAENNILSKSYIESCQIEPVDPSSVLIKVTEGKMTSLEGVLGFTRVKDKNELTGHLNLSFLNLWGSDRALALNWRKLPSSSLLELAYHESGPNSFPLAADISLSRDEETESWIRSTVGTDIYSYWSVHRYGLELSYENVNEYLPSEKDSLIVRRSSASSIGAFWRMDSRDRIFNPNKGMETDLTYCLWQKGERGWSNALEANHVQHIGITPRWTCSLGLHLRSLSDSTALDHELYRMGGFNSLRGYREDEFSGWRLGWGALELRWLINPQARIYLFYDHGLLVSGQEKLRSNLFAPGIGIKMRTRLGILSVEYALGYRENGFSDFGSGMIHAGLDALF
jgi:outer membrane protein assembly factor BamA